MLIEAFYGVKDMFEPRDFFLYSVKITPSSCNFSLRAIARESAEPSARGLRQRTIFCRDLVISARLEDSV